MKTITYRLDTSVPKEWGRVVFRRVEDDETLEYEAFVDGKWIPDGDACGAFVGFEPSEPLTEAEAMKLIKERETK